MVEQGRIKKLLGRRGTGTVFQSLCEESGDLEVVRKVAGVEVGTVHWVAYGESWP